VYELFEQPVVSNISFQKIPLCANVRRMIETSLLITKQSVILPPTPPFPGVTIYFRGVVPSICTYAWCETVLWYQTRPTDRKSGNTARLTLANLELGSAMLSAWDAVLRVQAGRLRVRLPYEVIGFFNQSDPLSLLNLKKKTPWSESASELYRPSDRHFSAK
jgi:hypothetical protein